MIQTEITEEGAVVSAGDAQPSLSNMSEGGSHDNGTLSAADVADGSVGDSMSVSLSQKVDSIQKASYVEEVAVDEGLVNGIPVPYNVAGDNFITSLLIFCFFAAATAFVRSSTSLLRQAKGFLQIQRGLTTEEPETVSEFRFQIALVAEACLLFGMVYFYYLKAFVTDYFSIRQYQLILLFALVFVAYFLVRTLLYRFVNWVFFEKKGNDTWIRANMFMYGTEGLLLLPVVLLIAYFNFPPRLAFTYIILVLGIIKALTFYKSYIVFFNKKEYILQNVLYFCALEVTPIACLWSALLMISDNLIIN